MTRLTSSQTPAPQSLGDFVTQHTDATLKGLEAALDSAIVPAIWQIEVANAFGKAVVRCRLTLTPAQEIGEELALPTHSPERTTFRSYEVAGTAVQHNTSIYGACYVHEARAGGLPTATNDHDPIEAAESCGLTAMRP